MDTDAVIQAILIGLPATVLGFLAYRRSRKVDAVAEQSGIANETRAGTAQIIEGLNSLVDALQEDNKTFRDEGRAFRDEVRNLTLRVNEVVAERDELRRERDSLRREVARLQLLII